MLIAIIIGFFVFCALGWWLFVSEVNWIERTLLWCSYRVNAIPSQIRQTRVRQQTYLRRGLLWVNQVYAWSHQHQFLLAVSFVLMSMPLLCSIILGHQVQVDAYEDTRYEANPQVSAILHGEQLSPPSPLPPDLFVSPEVTMVRPLLGGASREWAQLQPLFTQRLLTVFKVMKEQYGYEMVIIEGYRSPERQSMLAKLGGSVTNAGPYQSYHQFGLAADCAFLRDGKLVISEKDAWAMQGYQLYGVLAEDAGLTWGGRWKMMDFGHVELRQVQGRK